MGWDHLLPAERLYVPGAPPSRRLEFATGRWCARQALAQVGAPTDAPLTAHRSGAPKWPTGFIGSITHTAGWTGAVAAGRGFRAIGLDAEAAAPLPAGVLDVISSRRERDDVERLGALDPGVPWDTVLFTAKEAAYKAWFPMTGIVLSHDDIEVRLARDARFTAVARAGTAAGPRSGLGVRGQWALGPRAVISLAVVG